MRLLHVTGIAMLLGLALAVTGLVMGLSRPAAGPATGAAAPDHLAAPQAGTLATFDVDSVHSCVVFRIGHGGVGNFWGRFNAVTGQFTLDPEKGEAGAFQFEVDAASVDTANEDRDKHLRSPDFFNTAEHPKISFTSTSVQKSGAGTFKVTGTLLLHGVSKPITTDIKLLGSADLPRQGYKSGIETTFTVKRSDFGMTKYVAEGALSDEVTLFVAVEGKRQQLRAARAPRATVPVRQIVIAVLLPGFAAALLLLLAAARSGGPRGRWAAGLCVSAALLASYLIMSGWPGWTASKWGGRIEAWERWEWIVPIVAGTALLSLVNGLLASRAVPWLLVPLAAAGAALLVRPTAAVQSPWLWRALLGAAIVALYPCMDMIAARRQGPAAPAALAVWLAAASAVLMKASAFATLSLLAAAAAACCGLAAAGSALFARQLSMARGGTLAAAVILPLLLLVGWFYDFQKLRPAAYLLAALAPLALLATQARPLRRLRPMPALLVRLALVVIPAAGAVAVAFAP